MIFHVIRQGRIYLGTKFRDGHDWTFSNVTPTYDTQEWSSLSYYLNNNPEYRLTIFENYEAAKSYLDSQRLMSPSDFEIVKLTDLEEYKDE